MRKGRLPSPSRQNWKGRERLPMPRSREGRVPVVVVVVGMRVFSLCVKQFGTLVVEGVPLLSLNVTVRAAVRKDRQHQRAEVSDE